MKNLSIAILAALSLMMAACGGKDDQQRTDPKDKEPESKYADKTFDGFNKNGGQGDGVIRLEAGSETAKFNTLGHDYTVTISHQPGEQLPRLKDEDNNVYADNSFHIVISRDGKSFIDKDITKADVKHLLTPELKKSGMLRSIIYDSEQPGLNFVIWVCYPWQDDWGKQYLLTFDKAGNQSITLDPRNDID
jgi:hypothetical protein